KRIVGAFLAVTAAAVAWAVSPGTDVWIPSVGHGPGQYGSQWRTDVWISLPSGSAAATVDIYFLPRSEQGNSWPPESRRITVNPGETREFADIIKDTFGKDNAFGALRIVADREVLVTSRIYSAGLTIVTNQGNKTGSAGQFFAGLPTTAAIGANQTTDLTGLEESTTFRTNVGWVEVTGNECSLQVAQVDGNGTTVFSKTYAVKGYAVVQKGSILNELGGAGPNRRLRFTVVSGSGQVLVFGSRLDNNSNDPSTIEMRTPVLVDRSQGLFAGAFLESNAAVGGVSFSLGASGVSGFTGNGMVDCSGVPYTLDFGPNSTPAELDANGVFSFAVTQDYYDGSNKVLTVTWSITGQVASQGTATGVVQGTVTFTAPGWACTGLTQSWRAGWVSP
ncbi:MAG: hypothetical protein ACK42L_09365, partial [Thermoanaerobaculum sp.]